MLYIGSLYIILYNVEINSNEIYERNTAFNIAILLTLSAKETNTHTHKKKVVIKPEKLNKT